MKVTVCFGPVSVVVPCGNGDILVRDLISQAVTRYRKASNKSNDATISVAALRSSDGAILDPDDRLADVVDDREQLAACLSNGGGGGGGGSGSELDEPSLGVPLVLGPRIGLMNLRGDGTSASSNSGSPSPTDFGLHHNHHHHHSYGVVGGNSHPATSRKDIEVTGQEAATGLMVDHLHLQVRRGSEPALNRISTDAPNTTGSSASSTSHHHHHADLPPTTTSNSRDYKRWSAAPIVDPTSDSDCEERDLEVVRRHPSGPRFARSGARVSMQIFGGGGLGSSSNGSSHNNAGYRWAEAADNALLSAATAPVTPTTTATTTPPDYEETMHRRTRSLRREPVGATSESIPLSDGHHHLYQQQQQHQHHLNNNNNNNMQAQSTTQLVVLPNEGGQPLGIHVVPDYSPFGNELGLLVQGVEPGGRIHRDGRIAVHDRIIEINSHPLKDVPFHRAQELFRNALQSRDLRLRIVKSDGDLHRASTSEQSDMTQQQQQAQQQQSAPSSRSVAAVSPTRKTPAVVPGTGRASNALMTVSTRKIGKKLDLELTKGHEGLGFSVTTRDNPAGGLCPIYIKNILPRGAAIEDGRLRSGDRLLEVNGVEMTGKTQSEVVSLLRNIPSGGVARLLISRQETEEEIQNQQIVQSSSSQPPQSSTQTQQTSPKLPRQMKSISRASEESLLLLPWKQREILTLDIPVHDTEKAGLGISVKGKTTSSSGNGTSDLGIFIKSVLHGGAASRDGRLCTNDQLLHVNGVSLQGRSNTEAMEGLRRAVHQEGPKPGHITLTVARKMHALKDREVTLEGQSQDDTVNGTVRLGCNGNGGDSSGSYDHSGGSSDQSGSTVIFVSGSGSDSRERNHMKDNRLSGISSDLRNESYYRATHETWNTTQLQETLMSSSKSNSGGHQTSIVQGPGRKQHSQNSPTVHLTPGEVVSIDGDYLPQSRPRPPSMMLMSTSNGSSVASTPDTTMNWHQPNNNNNNNIRGPSGGGGGQRSGPTDGRDRTWPEQPQPPQSPLSETSMRSDGRPSDSEAPTYTSQTSLDTDAPGFSRDQFGRQSMSEKRHASLDAKNTDTYQRNKKLREERERQKQSQPESEQQQQPQTSALKENMPPSDKPHQQENNRPLFVRPVDLPRSSSRDIGPTLGLKKSSSLESLQTVVQEIQMQEEEPQIGCYGYHRPTAIRVVRGRGCNESFRAAVDRSYDESGQPTDGTNKEPMETLDEALEVEVNEMMPPPRSPSDIGIPMLNNKNETRKSKKKNANAAGLLLKGLGSMFRFGKHRKSAPSSPESGHQSSGSDPTVSGHHLSMAGGNMIMPSSGNHQNERRSSSGHSGSIGRSSAMSEVDRHHVLRRTLPPDERDRAELGRQMAIAVARQAAQEEQKRIQHHYLRLMDQQQRQAAAAHDHQQKQQQQQQQGNATTTGDSTNRSQRLHQLRAQHQKRHAEQQRQSTHTPTEQFESNNKNVPEIIHGRSASYDPYNDVRKPRSRAAVGEPNTLMPIPAVPSYNNNYDEFQLNRRQQHYHSQRSARETRMSPPGGNPWSGADRPVSNYFEYESLHIAGHKVALSGPPYKPQQQQSGNRRPPNVHGDDGTTFFRRPDRNSTGHEFGGNHGRASQRESVYGASNYGSGSQNNPASRPAPLTGSKV